MKKPKLLLLGLLSLAIFLPSAGADTLPDGTPCVPVESQSWWQDASQGFPGRHIHLSVCFPINEHLSGVVSIPITVQLHNWFGYGPITALRLQVWGNSPENTIVKTVKLGCAGEQCTFTDEFDLDTSKLAYSGYFEFRLTANVKQTAIGTRMFQTTRWPAYIDNGKPPKSTGAGRIGAAGWYTGASYSNVFVLPADFEALTSMPLDAPLDVHVNGKREHLFVSLDPKFHADPVDEGTVLYDGPGGVHTVTIDPTTLDPSVPHKLFLRTDHVQGTPPGIASGVFVVTFTVDDTVDPPPDDPFARQ